MSDVYVECLIQAKASPLGKFFKFILIAVAVVLGIMSVGGILVAVLGAVAAGVGAYFVHLNTDIEYEYLYLDKELSVDKVMAKSKRKRVGTYTIEKMEAFAPIKSYHLDNYKNRTVKEVDYSIGEELLPDKRYALYYEGGVKVILSPSEELVKAMKSVAPRKVFTD